MLPSGAGPGGRQNFGLENGTRTGDKGSKDRGEQGQALLSGARTGNASLF
jgi:hypothetical protein